MGGMSNLEVIERTLKTSVLIDAFWDRWLVHGIDEQDLHARRQGFRSIENWVAGWRSAAEAKEVQAGLLVKRQLYMEAEQKYREASLCYNLIQWIYPEKGPEKEQWYKECLRAFRQADSLSEIETQNACIPIGPFKCYGRIRVPSNCKGCVIIIVPIDSTKEELFRYEADFLNGGYATLAFDGPGQGETYTFDGVRGYRQRWEQFMDKIIGFTAEQFQNMPIFLFGTSLGASWALYGSCHPRVSKTVAVSPAVEFERLNLPGYFLERMDRSCTLDPKRQAIPDYTSLCYRSPIYLFHGQKDQMVLSKDMYRLYESITVTKRMTEYENEGHCVNQKLDEVRSLSITWFNSTYSEEGCVQYDI